MKQIWNNNRLNLFKWKEHISSSRSNILLIVAVIFLPTAMRKATWLKWALKWKKKLLPSAVPTIQALPEANNSEVKRGPIQSADGEDSEVADRTDKKPRRS